LQVPHDAADLGVEGDGPSLAADRQAAADLVAIAVGRDARAAERQLRVGRSGEEVGASEVRIASLLARFGAECVNIRDDGGLLGVVLVDVDFGGELAELPPNSRDHHVLDGEFDPGMGWGQGPDAHLVSSLPC
jgi:hypothetical protein